MDKYLKIDAGELLLCEGMRYQGGVIDDYFQGNGELFLVDNFEIKGKWQKGFLVTGQIIFHLLKQYKSLEIDIEKGKKIYTLHREG